MPREYSDERIAVGWDSKLCIHAGECGRGMPEVFDVNARPWVNVDNASGREAELAAVIRRFPSGALHYRTLDGSEPEPADRPLQGAGQRDGTLHVRGGLQVQDPEGGLIRRMCGWPSAASVRPATSRSATTHISNPVSRLPNCREAANHGRRPPPTSKSEHLRD